MTARIRVLHLFAEYLNITENWAFRLLDNLSDMDVVVGSMHFLKSNYYPRKFEYIEFPIKQIEQNQHRMPVRMFNGFVSGLLGFYPFYLSKMVGKVDLMHSHFANIGWQYRGLARKLNVPHVVSFYGFDYENLPYRQPVWKERYRDLFKEADLFLCEGRFGAGILEKIGCPPDKIKIARLGVEVASIPFSRREKKVGELRLLQIATFNEKKGIQGSPAEEKVTFIDRVDFERLYSFMSDFHVFIHPSCYSAEMDCEGGAPVVLLDAQATGMPVIATTHCDIPDEVVHGETGLLTPEKDFLALAQSIKRFYAMGDEEYQGFAKSARSHMEKNYDAKALASVVGLLYQDLIGTSGLRRRNS
jgi:colanic acid/amylovoran biosynthesis glycosyltransferase